MAIIGDCTLCVLPFFTKIVWSAINILTACLCVCVCVCVTEVGCSWGGSIDYSDARPSYFNLLNLELCPECLRTLGMGWNIPEQLADAIGEQQSKRTQLGSFS